MCLSWPPCLFIYFLPAKTRSNGASTSVSQRNTPATGSFFLLPLLSFAFLLSQPSPPFGRSARRADLFCACRQTSFSGHLFSFSLFLFFLNRSCHASAPRRPSGLASSPFPGFFPCDPTSFALGGVTADDSQPQHGQNRLSKKRLSGHFMSSSLFLFFFLPVFITLLERGSMSSVCDRGKHGRGPSPCSLPRL